MSNTTSLFVLLAKWDVMTGGQGSDKALTTFVGLDARTDQSGTRNRRGHISKTGDPEMRRLLYMATLGGKRGKNPLRDFYERLVGLRENLRLRSECFLVELGYCCVTRVT